MGIVKGFHFFQITWQKWIFLYDIQAKWLMANGQILIFPETDAYEDTERSK